ncbi:hypothetical protein MANES_16G093350v8 [Manihot esculenta]|uniref:Uncharacterized protein n=1 Tax=Manihot esculenta TaxID=3983 RepID=A0ACB7G725_MANES|nr:hypothetical protein MANES_16G093350v8 [Manihot esculenta]
MLPCAKSVQHVCEELQEHMQKKVARKELDKKFGDDEYEDEIVGVANAKVSHKGMVCVGEANVDKVMTNNASNCMLMLEIKHPHFYWTPCAANCVDLILEDIGNIAKFHNTIKRAVALSSYIYVRSRVVNMLRRFTSERELIRPAITTSFFTLQHMHKNKTNLRKTLTSEEWTRTMDRTKEAIAKTFGENEDKYKEIFEIIDKRRESQLHQPLHAKGYYLNPEYFYSNKNIEQDEEVMTSSYQLLYQNGEGIFGMPIPTRNWTLIAPAEWWKAYGASTPNLRNFAIKVHSKKKNRLAQQRLNDLVFVKYNRSLKRKYDARRRVDPISLKEIDDSNEWLMGQMQEELNRDELVFKDDNLTWNMVGEATGAYEDAYNTRTGKRRSVASYLLQKNQNLHQRRKEKHMPVPLV